MALLTVRDPSFWTEDLRPLTFVDVPELQVRGRGGERDALRHHTHANTRTRGEGREGNHHCCNRAPKRVRGA